MRKSDIARVNNGTIVADSITIAGTSITERSMANVITITTRIIRIASAKAGASFLASMEQEKWVLSLIDIGRQGKETRKIR